MKLVSKFTAFQLMLLKTTVRSHTHVLLAGQGKLICQYAPNNEPYAFNGLIDASKFDSVGQYKYGPDVAIKAFGAWVDTTGFKIEKLSELIKTNTVWNEGASFETGSCLKLESYPLGPKLPVQALPTSHSGPCTVQCALEAGPDIILFKSINCIVDAPKDFIPLEKLDEVEAGMTCHFLWLALHSPEGIQVYNFAWKVASVEGGSGGQGSGGKDDGKGDSNDDKGKQSGTGQGSKEKDDQYGKEKDGQGEKEKKRGDDGKDAQVPQGEKGGGAGQGGKSGEGEYGGGGEKDTQAGEGGNKGEGEYSEGDTTDTQAGGGGKEAKTSLTSKCTLRQQSLTN